ncbi:endonuclease III [Candidatus Woesearchaeota archaeon CG_4_10_14_0_2_um_filter_33_10]|nr:MAG: endonuclease III [Candidatus Woesearchaeota archaeon CG1_02_33_12]PIN78234.1 MAG: endonuclease III [Candidatus Woesearchaeota archaeon CG10_big_fil_rev_8_21_14_0_10_33_12]PIZ53536.1 MAG: endonuclease III [Candidatus Woesearchaeota archaeon CG_4_10_14_0_2_um_filter_33_10]
MNLLKRVYNILLKKYGFQGWWPLLDCNGTNPTKTGLIKGYHPKDYSYPGNNKQRFEICIGAILTQNTSWPQVEKALLNIKGLKALTPQAIKKLSLEKLKQAIKPAGYFNQKARKIKEFTDFYLSLKNRVPTREELLNVWGIGPETADSILLYAFKVPTFVVDAYTRRIFSKLGFIKKHASYEEIKKLFENNLEKDLKLYQEYHSLIVEHAKRHYSKKPYGKNDLLLKVIKIKRFK